jgi:signal transduction histidine kinase
VPAVRWAPIDADEGVAVSETEDQVEGAIAERARLTALHALRILDTPAEERFDRITRTAARVFGVPIALINLVGADRQWSKSCVGLDELDIPREHSFCAHDLDRLDVLVVPDATRDERFECNPLVVGAPHIRFYAGAVIRSADGLALGRLCVIDDVPRDPAAEPLGALTDLAAWVELELHGGAAPARGEDPDALALMQERFLIVAAHELRTPLTLISGYSEELLESGTDRLDADQRRCAAAIARGADRLQTLVDDLLLVLELDAGRVAIEPRRFAPAQLVADVCAELSAEADRRGVRVEPDVWPAAVAVGDPRKLAVALAALLRNAIAWSPRQGTVRIGATSDAEGLRLTISDEGPGLPAGVGDALGRRFHRARGLDSREGAGLGHAIARGLVELHGGRLEAGEPRAGAAVSIVLPPARGLTSDEG